MNTRKTYETAKEAALRHVSEDTALRALCHTAAAAVHHEADHALRSFIELGRAGSAIESDRRWAGADLAVEVLAIVPGTDRRTIRQAIQLVRSFSSEQLESFLTRRSLTGRQITPAHLCVMTRAPSAMLRDHLIEFFYDRSPTVKTLRAELARQQGHRPTDTPPRILSMSGAVSNVTHLTRILQSRLEVDLDEVLFARLRVLADGTGKPRQDDLAQVADLQKHLAALLPSVQAVLDITGKARTALEQRQAAQQGQ